MNMLTRFPRVLALVAAVLLAQGTAQAKYFRTVVIDAGHGGHDKGGQWGKVYEKHLCLDTAARLEAYLKANGVRTVMTRRSDHFISLPGRVSIAKKYPGAIFVSIHYNYTWKQQVGGLETFFYSPESQPLAAHVQQGMLRKVRTVDRGVKFARFYVLRHATCPSVLVECGFVSQDLERERMKRAWYRQSIAEGIGAGILRYKRS